MTDYTSIKSKYVRNKLKKLKYSQKNRDYIKKLMWIEGSILGGPNNWAGGIFNHQLMSSYPKDYNAIYRELDPEGFKQWKKQKKIDKENHKRWEKEYKEQEKRDEEFERHTWKIAAGKTKETAKTKELYMIKEVAENTKKEMEKATKESDSRIHEEWMFYLALFQRIAKTKMLNKKELWDLGNVFQGNMCQYRGGKADVEDKIWDEINKIVEVYKE